ncbi:hypothetical protein [Actinoplanes sp. NPDC026623]|uniref:hypothetical protein n=1 Tax=Actinoplanes sp. NPDC026623 TaxID=3155610 RepID=UPI0033D6791D
MNSPQGDKTAPPPRRTPRLWPVIAAVLLVAAGGGTFAWWGSPRLAEGGLSGPGKGMSWADDGVETTRMIVRGKPADTVSATFSISNQGHLPITVGGLDLTEMAGWLHGQRVAFVAGYQDFGEVSAPRDRVTLGPGEVATVLWSLDMSCWPGLSENSTMSVETLRFRVSWLGIGTTRELSLERPITFVGDDRPQPAPPADCATGR